MYGNEVLPILFLYWYWYGLYFYLEVLIEVLAILFKPIIIQYFLAILFFSNFVVGTPFA